MSGSAEYRVMEDKILIDPELPPEANLAAAIIRRAIMDAKRYMSGLDDDLYLTYHNVEDMLYWWEKLGVLDLNENHEQITDSWKYEHQLLELVRLYKSINWKEKCLLFYGY